jgi:hypothetical protein
MRRIGVALVGLLVLSACGASGGSGGTGASVANLQGVAASLKGAGLKCKAPGKPKDGDEDFGAAKAPLEEVECTDHAVQLSVARWKTESDATATMSALLIIACGFGMKKLDYVQSGNWIGTTDDTHGSSKAQATTMAKAAAALGRPVTHHRCPKGSGSAFDQVTTTTEAGPGRTRTDALEIGDSSKIGDYRVSVTKVEPDATAEVQGMNEFNDPPKKGQYLLATYEVTYQGKSEGQPGYELTLALSGSDHVQYDQCEASVGDSDIPTLERGGTATITECIDAPAAAIDGGVLLVKDGFNEHRAYWSIPG